MAVADKTTTPPPESASEPEPKPPGPRRLDPPEPARLLDERYQIAVLDPTRLAAHPTRIDQESTRLVRNGWRRQTIEENRAWFGHQDHSSMMVLRPLPEGQSQIGFRGVSADHLAEMRAEGFEPAWVVKVGSSYDVLLRTHERMSHHQTNELWTEIGARFGLQVPGGFYRDAVRMPGAGVHLPEGRVVAELVECSSKPFSSVRAARQGNPGGTGAGGDSPGCGRASNLCRGKAGSHGDARLPGCPAGATARGFSSRAVSGVGRTGAGAPGSSSGDAAEQRRVARHRPGSAPADS